MGLTELTPAQQATVDALVVARRLERVPIDANRCTSFLEQARVALADLPNVTHAQNRHNLAYDAAHDVGEAMLAGYGCRARSSASLIDAPRADRPGQCHTGIASDPLKRTTGQP